MLLPIMPRSIIIIHKTSKDHLFNLLSFSTHQMIYFHQNCFCFIVSVCVCVFPTCYSSFVVLLWNCFTLLYLYFVFLGKKNNKIYILNWFCITSVFFSYISKVFFIMDNWSYHETFDYVQEIFAHDCIVLFEIWNWI